MGRYNVDGADTRRSIRPPMIFQRDKANTYRHADERIEREFNRIEGRAVTGFALRTTAEAAMKAESRADELMSRSIGTSLSTRQTCSTLFDFIFMVGRAAFIAGSRSECDAFKPVPPRPLRVDDMMRGLSISSRRFTFDLSLMIQFLQRWLRHARLSFEFISPSTIFALFCFSSPPTYMIGG